MHHLHHALLSDICLIVQILEKFAGKDATTQFQMFHYPRGTAVKWGSESMYVGPLDEGEKKANGSAGGLLGVFNLNPLQKLLS
eukprot:1367615-Amorphochlora_amoeboformis.AAC.1